MTRLPSLCGRMVASPGQIGPVTEPRMVQGATMTREFRRMRFAFPVFAPVNATIWSPSKANQMGVDTPLPSRLKVVRLMYFSPRSRRSAGSGDDKVDQPVGYEYHLIQRFLFQESLNVSC